MRIPSATPFGMSRRHFMGHLAAAGAMAGPAISFTNALAANSEDLRKRHKAAILLWMGGGPSTMDIWDLKPGASTGGPFKPISTSASGVEISEHMPLMAKQMHHMAIIRNMSTREADHNRARYYMHTGYVPNPQIEHPGYGSVISHELASQVPNLEIPPFVSVGGGSVGPGFLEAGADAAAADRDEGGHLQVRHLAGQLMADHRAVAGMLDLRIGHVAGVHVVAAAVVIRFTRAHV